MADLVALVPRWSGLFTRLWTEARHVASIGFSQEARLGVDPLLRDAHGSAVEIVWHTVEHAAQLALISAGDVVGVLVGAPTRLRADDRRGYDSFGSVDADLTVSVTLGR